ncbi:MAG: hypothetical protein OET18_17715, partial [Desulfobacterales bacterium]|nr:hypothetical protein [Desulfobacterales bacterium]
MARHYRQTICARKPADGQRQSKATTVRGKPRQACCRKHRQKSKQAANEQPVAMPQDQSDASLNSDQFERNGEKNCISRFGLNGVMA